MKTKLSKISAAIVIMLFALSSLSVLAPKVELASASVISSQTVQTPTNPDSANFDAFLDFNVSIQVNTPDLSTLSDATNSISVKMQYQDSNPLNIMEIDVFSDEIGLVVVGSSEKPISFPGGVGDMLQVSASISVGSNITVLFVHDGDITVLVNSIQVLDLSLAGPDYSGGFSNILAQMSNSGGPLWTGNVYLSVASLAGSVFYTHVLTPVSSSSTNNFDPVWDFSVLYQVGISDLSTISDGANYVNDFFNSYDWMSSITVNVYSDAVTIDIFDNLAELVSSVTVSTTVFDGSTLLLVFVHSCNLTLFNDGVEIYTVPLNGGDGYPSGFAGSTLSMTGTGAVTVVINDALPAGTTVYATSVNSGNSPVTAYDAFSPLFNFNLTFTVGISDLETYSAQANQISSYIVGGTNRVDLYIYSDALSAYISDGGVELISNPVVYASVALGDNVSEVFHHEGNVSLYLNGVELWTASVAGGDGFSGGFENAFSFASGSGDGTYETVQIVFPEQPSISDPTNGQVIGSSNYLLAWSIPSYEAQTGYLVQVASDSAFQTVTHTYSLTSSVQYCLVSVDSGANYVRVFYYDADGVVSEVSLAVSYVGGPVSSPSPSSTSGSVGGPGGGSTHTAAPSHSPAPSSSSSLNIGVGGGSLSNLVAQASKAVSDFVKSIPPWAIWAMVGVLVVAGLMSVARGGKKRKSAPVRELTV